MKKLLIGLLALGSISVFANVSNLPTPCELKCEAISKQLPEKFVVNVRWDGDKKTKRYYLMENSMVKAPKKGFYFDGQKLQDLNVRIQRFADKKPLEIWLPGFVGDIDLIPENLKDLMISEDDFNAQSEVSINGKKDCRIDTFSTNSFGKIESQVFESLSDFSADFAIKGSGAWETYRDGSISYYGLLLVISDIKRVEPFARKRLTQRLLELQNIGVCNSRT
jgi:hypothetical protein